MRRLCFVSTGVEESTYPCRGLLRPGEVATRARGIWTRHDCASPRCLVPTDFRNRKLTLFRLIAIMLGRLRMDDREVMSTFMKTMSEVFSPTNIRSRIPLTSKYHHKTLEAIIRNTVAAHCKQHSYHVLCGADMLVWPWEVDKERLMGSPEPEYSPGDAICQT